MDVNIGQVIAGYEIQGLLGKGGQSSVYLARDVKLQRLVAIKFPADQLLADEVSRRRFLLEAVALSSLNHPNIAVVYHAGEFGDQPFIVMEYLEGYTLTAYIEKFKPSLGELTSIMVQITQAVVYAHQRGVLHRDLKPGNIMVLEEGVVKLVDFGLAKFTQRALVRLPQPGQQLTTTGVMVGTMGYLSPEQGRGEEIDERSDLFSLGIIFFEMLTGKNPFQRDTALATAVAIINDSPAPFPDGIDIPDHLKTIVLKLLEKRRDDRFQSAACLLEQLQEPTPYTLLSTTKYIRPAQARRLNRRMVLYGALLALAGVIITLAYFTFRKRSSPQTGQVILVLPIAGAADEKSRQYAELVTGEIVSALSASPRLRVMYFPVNYRELGGTLTEKTMQRKDVRYVVDGNLSLVNGEMFISLRVVDNSDSAVLWAESFRAPVEKYYSTTGRIASAVASVAGVYLSLQDIPFPGPAVFEYYTRALITIRRREPAQLEQAVADLKKCLELAPDFAPAYGALADAYMNFRNIGLDDDPRYLDEAGRFVQEGLRHGLDQAEYHYLMGRLAFFRTDSDRAAEEFQRAIELKPSGDEWRYLMLSQVLIGQGELDKAFENLNKAKSINPFNPVIYVNQVVEGTMTGRSAIVEEAYAATQNLYSYPQATAIIEGWWRANRADWEGATRQFAAECDKGRYPLLCLATADMEFACGRYRPAAEYLERWLAKNKYSLEGHWLLCLSYRLLGEEEKMKQAARQATQRVVELESHYRTPRTRMCWCYFSILSGETPTEQVELEKELASRDSFARYLQTISLAYLGKHPDLKRIVLPYHIAVWQNRFAQQEIGWLQARRKQ